MLRAGMTRAEKAQRIRAILRDLYPDPPIPLDHRDPFTLLVAVLLSAQTTDARVNQVTPGLFAIAPDAHAMAKLPVERIHDAIRTCGLAPGKARNLSALSKILVEEYGGRVPDDLEALEALPGVGHKTASVVVAQAFGRPAFPVDTHIHRLAARWGLSSGRSVEQTERDLKALFDESDWDWIHLAIIYFGREHCPARGHDLRSCPICSWAATEKRKREEAAAGGGGPRARKAAGTRKGRGASGEATGKTRPKRAKASGRKAARKSPGKRTPRRPARRR
jgi:endonuclease-3